MSGFSRTRRLGSWGAWAAAYALILNSILTSALAAAIPPDQYATAFELCLSSKLLTGKIAATTAKDAADKQIKDSQKGSPIHCPMCVPNIGSAATLPTAPALAARVAISQPPAFPADRAFAAVAQILFHYAHGPPRLT